MQMSIEVLVDWHTLSVYTHMCVCTHTCVCVHTHVSAQIDADQFTHKATQKRTIAPRCGMQSSDHTLRPVRVHGGVVMSRATWRARVRNGMREMDERRTRELTRDKRTHQTLGTYPYGSGVCVSILRDGSSAL